MHAAGAKIILQPPGESFPLSSPEQVHRQPQLALLNRDQIRVLIARMKQQRVRTAIENADAIVLSIGANDLFRSPGAREETLRAPLAVADRILTRISGIVADLHQTNPRARILLLGGYNTVPSHPYAHRVDPREPDVVTPPAGVPWSTRSRKECQMIDARTTAVLLAICTGLTVPTESAAKTALTLGATEGASKGFSAVEMAPVMRHLNASPDYVFELKVFPTQDDLCRALASGEVHVALVGALKYVEAHAEMGAIPIVSEGAKSRSVIVVPDTSTIKSVAELKGKRFAFGYRDSTMTYLIPSLLLSKYGIHKTDIQSAFVGYHPQDLVDQMLAGRFDACAVSEYILEKNKTRVRPLEASDPFPGPAIVARKDLSPSILAAVRQLFTTYRAAPGEESRRFGRGAVPITDADYNRIRFLAKVLFNKTYH